MDTKIGTLIDYHSKNKEMKKVNSIYIGWVNELKL